MDLLGLYSNLREAHLEMLLFFNVLFYCFLFMWFLLLHENYFGELPLPLPTLFARMRTRRC